MEKVKSSSSGSNPYPCNFCDRTFTSEVGLLLHFREKHYLPQGGSSRSSTESESGSESDEDPSDPDEGGRSLPPPVSENDLEEREGHGGTIKIKPQLKPSKTGTVTVTSKLSDKIKNQDKIEREQFDCVFCGKRYSHQYLFQDHLRTHTLEKPYFCKLCGKCFRVSNYLTNHMKRDHATATPYKCQFCPASFSTQRKLTNHCKVHRGENQYLAATGNLLRCSECGKEFKRKYHLEQHMTTHSKERAFKCQYCDQTFAHDYNLKRHIRRHTGDNRYKCEHCGKGYSRADRLKSHIKQFHNSENPFICPLCGNKFLSKEGLNIHKGLAHPPKSRRRSKKNVI